MILADAPGNIIITKNESKLKKDSVIILSQVEKLIKILNLFEKSVMTDKVFVDSNIWCYLFLQDEKAKYKIDYNIMASEDMQDGLKINNMVIKNIFK